ncbi:hypothetical protein GQ54DRAFT_277002 [Martensiomyces pterosporus]|nr:hypothetical protein GQ54DRAFT_277002 [Martensiomyces pterosporus]
MKIDPIGRGDTVAIIFGASIYGVTLLLFIYAWLNRSYAPIRAKNIWITTLMYISGILWFVGDIATNGHVELVGAWSICKLWAIWFRVFFSFSYSVSIALRVYALYRVFILHRPYKGRSVYLPVVAMFGCLIVFCVVSQVVSDSHTVMYIKEFEVCSYVWAFRGACIGLYWVVWLVILFLVVRIRHIHTSFNERYESFLICLLGFSGTLILTVVHTTHPNYTLQMHLRVANTCIDAANGNLGIWVVLLYPCYQSVFNRERYLQTWVAKLKADGLRKEYNMSPQYNSVEQGYSKMDSSSETKQNNVVPDMATEPITTHSGIHWDANAIEMQDQGTSTHAVLNTYPDKGRDSRYII